MTTPSQGTQRKAFTRDQVWRSLVTVTAGSGVGKSPAGSEKYVLTFSVKESGALIWRLEESNRRTMPRTHVSAPLESLYTSESNNEAS